MFVFLSCSIIDLEGEDTNVLEIQTRTFLKFRQNVIKTHMTVNQGWGDI